MIYIPGVGWYIRRRHGLTGRIGPIKDFHDAVSLAWYDVELKSAFVNRLIEKRGNGYGQA